MKFKLWPTNVKLINKRFHNRYTGKKETYIKSSRASVIHCPKCYQVLEYISSCLHEEEYNGTFCFDCGRDLRKPFTKYEKIRHWLRWIGDKKLLSQWPIGYLE